MNIENLEIKRVSVALNKDNRLIHGHGVIENVVWINGDYYFKVKYYDHTIKYIKIFEKDANGNYIMGEYSIGVT